jgi:glyoxylate reductase
LAQSDFVALNCPLTTETTGLIGARELAQMKPSAFLINMARGGVVQTDALTAALQNRQIAGAAVDVTDPEPLPRNHPLLALDNLVITPHLGSASDRTRRRMIEMSIINLRAGLLGQPLSWQVQPTPAS